MHNRSLRADPGPDLIGSQRNHFEAAAGRLPGDPLPDGLESSGLPRERGSNATGARERDGGVADRGSTG